MLQPDLAFELREREREALHSVFHRLETRWHDVFDSGSHHAWDPLPFWDFLTGVRVAEEYVRGNRFLDVGCGIGTKLAIMHEFGWNVSGIDHHLAYVEAARELIHERANNILHADALESASFDADLVYMYRPMKTDEDEYVLERHLAGHVKSGTVVFLPTRRVESLGLTAITIELGIA